jgi:cytochrome c oxidase subunit 2
MNAILLAQLEQIQLFPKQASRVAPHVDMLFFYWLGIAVFFTILIAVLVIYFAIRYRRRPGHEIARQIEGSMALEIFWSAVPLGLVMVLFVWGAVVYFEQAHAPDDALQIEVTAKQWMWHLYHVQEGYQRENQELHVPVNRPILLKMTSTDVVHDFAIPEFRVRQDVFPFRETSLSFTPTQTGKFRFFCAEYCGTNHSQMIGWVIVQEPHEYQQWLAGQKSDGSVASKGRKLFLQLQCIACHSATSQAQAPVLEELYGKEVRLTDGTSVIANDAYLRESILKPEAKIVAGYRPIMPTYDGQITEEELLQLVAFIKHLGRGETPPRVEFTEPPTVINRRP